MRSDLMAVVVHLLDNASPVLIDSTLSNVVSSDEESGMGSPRLEQLHHSLGVDVWAIIESNGNSAGVVADVDTLTTIGNASELRASIVTGACSSRGFVGIAARTKIEQAVWCLAMLFSGTAIS